MIPLYISYLILSDLMNNHFCNHRLARATDLYFIHGAIFQLYFTHGAIFHLYFIHGGNLSAGCRSTPGKVFFSAEPFLLCDSVQFSFQLTATGAVCESGPKLRNPCGFLSYPLKPQLWMSGIPVLQTLHKSSSCYWL